LRKPVEQKFAIYNDPLDRRITSVLRNRMDPAKYAVNIFGIPYDGGVLGRKGASAGPASIRDSLRFNSNFNPELGTSLRSAKILDLGDLVIGRNDVKTVQSEIMEEVSTLLLDSSLLLAIGGDNSLSLPMIKAYARKYGNIGLIAIDSHYDLRGQIRGNPTSGSSYGLAISALGKRLPPSRVVEVALHGFLNSVDYSNRASDLGITVYTADDVRNLGAIRTAKRAFELVSQGSQAVYVSADIDSIDLSSVSGVSAPSPGGLAPAQLFDLLFYLGQRPQVRCADIVETAPSLDLTGRTPIVAATALLYLAAGFFSRRTKI
jgi:formimidoylglutamase